MRRRHLLLLATTALMPCAAALAGGPPPPVPTQLPTGPQTQGGSATYTTNSNTLTVNQFSQNLITNWITFNIGSRATVNFAQPNASAIALNRVTGDTNPSQIMGTLNANGIVFLVNPNGVIFGKNSTVNAAGFLATTHDIKNSDFMGGKYNFTIPGNPTASIVNFGNITATSGGFAALVAPGVRNDGVITARLGTVGLASSGQGFTLDMYGDKLITLAVNDSVASKVMDVSTGQPLAALVANNGTLSANGGRVEITAAAAKYVVDSVINNKGTIEANAVAQKGGTIVLAAATANSKPAGAPAQNVKLAGTITAAGKSAGQKGGTIKVTGENILMTGAKVDASGQAGGGTVSIGGKGTTATATTVTADTPTTIDASAIQNGDGGNVVVWADQLTTMAATIKATGGALGGNGGLVETSGGAVNFAGIHVDTSAPFGKTGTWLVDPYDLTIKGDAAATIASNLSATNVTVETTASSYNGPGVPTAGHGDIDVASSIAWSSGNTLTLSAYRNITVEPNVVIANTGSGSLTLRSDNAATGTGGLFFKADAKYSPNSYSYVDFTQSTGIVSLYYNVNSVIGVRTNSQVSNQLQLHLPSVGAAAYMTGAQDPWLYQGNPLSRGSLDWAMNTAFGAGNWTKFYGFNSAPLNGSYKFVYIDGGGINSATFNSFVANNVPSLQSYVQSGGALFLNAARWTGGTDPGLNVSGNLDVGFGATLHFANDYSLASYTGTAVDPSNPIFQGPMGSAGSSWSGSYFSHDMVSGASLQPLISGTSGTVLADEKFGAGLVMIGGMTTPFFHSPQPQADNLLANILAFTASQSTIGNQSQANGGSPNPGPPDGSLGVQQIAFLTPPPNNTNPGSLNFTPINLGPTGGIGGNAGNGGGTGGNGDVTGSLANGRQGGNGAPLGTRLIDMPIIPLPPGSGMPPPGETHFSSNHVVFQIGNAFSPQQVADIAALFGLTVESTQTFDILGRTVYTLNTNGKNVRDVIRLMEARKIGGFVQPDYGFRFTQDATAPDAGIGDPAQYVIDKFHLPDSHRITRGDNVTVAVIDSEIDANHPDLAGVVSSRFDAGCGNTAPDAHGTGMTGAIASHQHLLGVAPHAKIIAICAFGGDAAGESTSIKIIKGLDYAIQQGARIVNMSFAGPRDPTLAQALQIAREKGVLLIAAAGNAGPKSPPLYPGADPNVLAVTATDDRDRLFKGANQGKYITVAAPGVDVLVPAPNESIQLTTGTSVATAHVSGVAALLLAQKSSRTPEEIRAILVQTAKHLGPKGSETQFGAGLVDPLKALRIAPASDKSAALAPPAPAASPPTAPAAANRGRAVAALR